MKTADNAFLNKGRTLNIAHRGASIAAPPNTLAAFEKAIALGADGIEFDVHLSADGVPVVIHDFAVDTTTNGSGRVADLTLAQLKQLDAGVRFNPAFAGERVPTLGEVLEAVGSRLLLNIELKTTSLRDNGLEQAVIAQVKRHGLDDHVLFSSFNPFSLRRAKRIAPHIPVGLLTPLFLPPHRGGRGRGLPPYRGGRGRGLPPYRGGRGRWAWLAFLFPHEARHPEHKMVDARYMAWARRQGYRVNTWTVDDPAEMRRLIGLGVDGIITNVPDLLGSILASPA